MKLKWTIPDIPTRGFREYRAGDAYVIRSYELKQVAPRRLRDFFVVFHDRQDLGEAPTLQEAKAIAQRDAEWSCGAAASRIKRRRTEMKRKHYRDLSIDEPLPHDPAIEAEVNSASPEQVKQMFEEAWFTNPGGIFRRRILRKFENAGLMRIVETPEGYEIQVLCELDLVGDVLATKDLIEIAKVRHLIGLLEAVDFELDEPYDPERWEKQQQTNLRSAKPHLICRVEHGHLRSDPARRALLCQPYIISSDSAPDWGELLDEGFDPSGKTGLGPVYYCLVDRADELFSLNTFMVGRDRVRKLWGSDGLRYCDPVTGLAPARIEVPLPKTIDLQDDENNHNVYLAAGELAFLKACGEDTDAMVRIKTEDRDRERQ